jgi:hypothetical protein
LFGNAESVQRNPGETVVEWKTRAVQKDLDAFHAEAKKIEAKYDGAVQDLKDRVAQLQRDRQENAQKYASASSPKAAKDAERKHDEITKEIAESKKRIDALEKEADAELHYLVGRFTEAHGGAIGGASDSAESYQISKTNFVSAERASAVKMMLGDGWRWLNKIVPAKRLKGISDTKIKLRQGGGGSHDGRNKEIEIGVDSESESIAKTIRHEYGHFVEDGSNDTMLALAEDYWKRVDSYTKSNGGVKYFKHSQVSFYEAPHPPNARARLPEYGDSVLGYSRRYSDFAYDKEARGYNPSPRRAGGTEVFSTGLEHLFHSPRDFRRKHKSHFNLTLLVLSGLI